MKQNESNALLKGTLGAMDSVNGGLLAAITSDLIEKKVGRLLLCSFSMLF